MKMSLVNHVRLAGYCADDAKLGQTQTGIPMATLTIYTREHVKNGEDISLPHRCVCFGKLAEAVVKHAERGRHLTISGRIRTIRKGEGDKARYYTNILIDEFLVSPRQSVEAVKDMLRELVEKRNIQSTEELAIFQDDTYSNNVTQE